jgi:hypothetical protein
MTKPIEKCYKELECTKYLPKPVFANGQLYIASSTIGTRKASCLWFKKAHFRKR